MKYFLFNHAGSKNHGCEALVRGTVNIIENSDGNAEFALSSYDAQADNIDGVEVKQSATRELTFPEKIIAALDLRINKSEEYALEKMYSTVVADASECDVCLSVGGDTYCYGNNHGIQVLTKELKKAGKKVILWGASIGKEDLTEEKLKSLGDFDAIFAREPITFELLKEANANDKIFLFSDPAFCMERASVEMPEGFTRENTLGFNISPLIAKSNPKTLEIAENFIDFIFENTTLKVLLVPHVVEDNNNDYEFMKPVYEKFSETGRIAILPQTLNAMQYKGYIAHTRFFIGARTHSTIAAYSSGVPTIALGYSVKARGIAKDIFGEERNVLNFNSMTDAVPLKKEFLKLVEEENEIKGELMRSIPLRMRSAMEAGEMLQKI